MLKLIFIFLVFFILNAEQRILEFDSSAASGKKINLLWKKQYKLNTESEGGGLISTASNWYFENTEVEIKATPFEGFVFGYWEGDINGTKIIASNHIKFNMNKSRSIKAVFVPQNSFFLRIEPFIGLSQKSSVGKHPRNSFVPWSVTSPYYENENTRYICKSKTNGNVFIFSKPIIINLNWVKEHKIKFNSIINGKKYTKEKWIKDGELLSLEPIKDTGYEFIAWQNSNGDILSNEENLAITIDGPFTINSLYKKDTLKLEVQSPYGEVSGNGEYKLGEVADWELSTDEIKKDDNTILTTTAKSGSIKMYRDEIIKINWEKKFKVVFEDSKNGEVEAKKDTWVKEGEKVFAFAQANTDYSFTHWKINGKVLKGNPLNLEVKNPTKIKAVFSPNNIDLNIYDTLEKTSKKIKANIIDGKAYVNLPFDKNNDGKVRQVIDVSSFDHIKAVNLKDDQFFKKAEVNFSKTDYVFPNSIKINNEDITVIFSKENAKIVYLGNTAFYDDNVNFISLKHLSRNLILVPEFFSKDLKEKQKLKFQSIKYLNNGIEVNYELNTTKGIIFSLFITIEKNSVNIQSQISGYQDDFKTQEEIFVSTLRFNLDTQNRENPIEGIELNSLKENIDVIYGNKKIEKLTDEQEEDIYKISLKNFLSEESWALGALSDDIKINFKNHTLKIKYNNLDKSIKYNFDNYNFAFSKKTANSHSPLELKFLGKFFASGSTAKNSITFTLEERE